MSNTAQIVEIWWVKTPERGWRQEYVEVVLYELKPTKTQISQEDQQ